ncbi:hypothetical protein DO021_01640 [Desulfobacter hydrogenophilus]|uniref:Phosphatidylserine/phosphatidylglycerophosphate/ cardiolipin synthase family protein n=1 Tax=Desulfobacter hydrogenophilus TaxID=2291 RepID=A0A328FGP8_9BACT|nr:phosphatidylserine/phosphatidylglycerophosphate/cardiolipin synthase family protein [Desulfobacter hydrogenophilus]NDY71835.1 phosphatidylserine/phosphatidylglycerophosphate/cardiolipin synthase family protein [Desulfobacter hydrogenophilus]QBH13531.1 phosphatidylserine/phosphatidylglycerophosphate/cardiolipin synthase family protein [Desulfobacter hydrogenophilus]RAM03781.1 hypothetical protein DO021_01640 [Desulfobacter hydrogenophilus]
MTDVKMMYGEEFWSYFYAAIQNAKRHVFIFTAYTNTSDLRDVLGKISHLPHLVVVRDDSNVSSNQIGNVILTDHLKFHAKVYVIDDLVIVGSQNLYKVKKISLAEKKGEISVAFKPDNAINIIYQSLMIVLQGEYEAYYENKIEDLKKRFGHEYDIGWVDFFREYKLESFLNLNSGTCPCCGSQLVLTERDEALFECSSNTYGQITQFECGIGNACKYCISDPILVEPEVTYRCSTCNFTTGYRITETYKRPYYSWEVLAAVTVPDQLESFLKLYFYLIDGLGEMQANNLLSSLGILGNLYRLNVSQRDYQILGF